LSKGEGVKRIGGKKETQRVGKEGKKAKKKRAQFPYREPRCGRVDIISWARDKYTHWSYRT
jgi:endogenous inhibitor of DNA gyrase (YacG/DUF329 family)